MDGHAPDVFLHGSAAERMAVAAESFVAAFVPALPVCLGGSLAGFGVAVLWSYLSPLANLLHMQLWTTHTFNVAILISILFYLNYGRRQVETGVLRYAFDGQAR